MGTSSAKSHSPTNLESLRKVHIIGVGGTLMGAFAAFLKRRGITVTGSDQNIYPPMSDVLKNAGIETFTGYSVENLTQMKTKPDLVVIGNVITAANPEAKAAIDGGYAYSSLPEAMENLMLRKTRNLVVAGTHGKTTTSSLLAFTLVKCGSDPSYFIGGVSQDLPHSFHVSKVDSGKFFVLEGDEYDTAFWDKVPKFNHYLPDDTILTSVEYDHADIYPNLEAVIKAFEGLIQRIRKNGSLIACVDYKNVKNLLPLSGVSTFTYGSEGSSARFTPANLRVEGEFTQFDVLDAGKKIQSISLRMSGHHNVLNALAVWIECVVRLGIDSQKVADALSQFQGVKRRQEVRGEIRGVLVIDDFAHHPTAVRETLKALRSRYPNRRMVAVFEPRSATSRRKVFQKDYATAFASADAVFISSPYDQSKISAENQFSSAELVSDIGSAGKKAALMATVDQGVIDVAKLATQGDLIAVLSNGGFEGFIPKLLKELEANSK